MKGGFAPRVGSKTVRSDSTSFDGSHAFDLGRSRPAGLVYREETAFGDGHLQMVSSGLILLWVRSCRSKSRRYNERALVSLSGQLRGSAIRYSFNW